MNLHTTYYSQHPCEETDSFGKKCGRKPTRKWSTHGVTPSGKSHTTCFYLCMQHGINSIDKPIERTNVVRKFRKVVDKKRVSMLWNS